MADPAKETLFPEFWVTFPHKSDYPKVSLVDPFSNRYKIDTAIYCLLDSEPGEKIGFVWKNNTLRIMPKSMF